jgi:hypothetical protein
VFAVVVFVFGQGPAVMMVRNFGRLGRSAGQGPRNYGQKGNRDYLFHVVQKLLIRSQTKGERSACPEIHCRPSEDCRVSVETGN